MWIHEIFRREPQTFVLLFAVGFISCVCTRSPPPLRRAPRAKPSSTSAVVLRPPSPGEQNRICSSGILWRYIGFVYGILFADRIITRKTRKSHRNTENKKNRLDGTHVVSSPAPTRNPRKSTEFTKRGQGRVNGRSVLISGCGEVTAGWTLKADDLS
jgi:hypothetical protein